MLKSAYTKLKLKHYYHNHHRRRRRRRRRHHHHHLRFHSTVDNSDQADDKSILHTCLPTIRANHK